MISITVLLEGCMSFFRRNWRVMAVGLVSGAVIEGLLIRGKFYDQMRNAKSRDIDKDWEAMDAEGKRVVLELEERYRKLAAERK